MRITLHPSFVLHHRPYRETSVLLDLLTQDHGRIAAIAKGVRQQRSRWRPLLQPFVPLLVSWQGKSELMTLIAAEPDGPPNLLKGDYLLSGFYLNELLMRLLPKYDPHPELYTIYQKTLLELQNSPFQQKTLRLFEKKLLDELGYGLPLKHDVLTKQAFVADKQYQFYLEHGFELWEEERPPTSTVFSGSSLLAFAAEQLDDAVSLRDAKRLIRLVLASLLGQNPLHSRRLHIKREKEVSRE